MKYRALRNTYAAMSSLLGGVRNCCLLETRQREDIETELYELQTNYYVANMKRCHDDDDNTVTQYYIITFLQIHCLMKVNNRKILCMDAGNMI